MNAGKRNERAGAAWPRRADQEEGFGRDPLVSPANAFAGR
jgi:hypothetical protein